MRGRFRGGGQTKLLGRAAHAGPWRALVAVVAVVVGVGVVAVDDGPGWR